MKPVAGKKEHSYQNDTPSAHPHCNAPERNAETCRDATMTRTKVRGAFSLLPLPRWRSRKRLVRDRQAVTAATAKTKIESIENGRKVWTCSTDELQRWYVIWSLVWEIWDFLVSQSRLYRRRMFATKYFFEWRICNRKRLTRSIRLTCFCIAPNANV